MRKNWMCCVCAVVLTSAVFCISAQADTGEWRIHLGPSFMSGFMDVTDSYENFIEERGYSTDSDWEVPVGLAVSATYEFSHGSRLAADIGPAGVIYVYTIGGSEDDFYFVDVPISASYGFSFVPHGNVSPYARVGVRHHIVSGDFVDSSTPGLFGAFGMEFMREKPIGWGFELAYDSSTIETKIGKEIEPGAFLASVFVSL